MNDKLDAKKLLASRLLDATRFDDRINSRYKSLEGRYGSTESAKKIEGILASHERRVSPETLRPHMIARYSERFSEEELRVLVDFYTSPVGQKFVASWSDEDGSLRDLIQKLNRG
jgi:hypothetical protein